MPFFQIRKREQLMIAKVMLHLIRTRLQEEQAVSEASISAEWTFRIFSEICSEASDLEEDRDTAAELLMHQGAEQMSGSFLGSALTMLYSAAKRKSRSITRIPALPVMEREPGTEQVRKPALSAEAGAR